MNPRLEALKIILEKKQPQANDSPLVYQLVYGTWRFYYQLKTIVDGLLKQPFSPKDNDIYILLLLGIYQIQHMNIPEYAIVQETVNVAEKLKKIWAKKLINAILRRFLRERTELENLAMQSEEGRWAHPQWLINKIREAYAEQWQSILTANNEKAPMHLRVNRLKISREEYQKMLSKISHVSQLLPNTQEGLLLSESMNVYDLPGFSEGWVSVQDAASQSVIDYLDLKPGLNILDACAAPGGKTAHLLEREPNIKHLTALDISSNRLAKISDNLKRLQLGSDKVTLLRQDASTFKNNNSGEAFDRILLDAPCSAIGVIRRHPDIKLHRTETEVKQVVQTQRNILEALWPLLKKQGKFVYTTCSILPEENQEQITHFLNTHSDAVLITSHQKFPPETDGFFYAVLERI